MVPNHFGFKDLLDNPIKAYISSVSRKVHICTFKHTHTHTINFEISNTEQSPEGPHQMLALYLLGCRDIWRVPRRRSEHL